MTDAMVQLARASAPEMAFEGWTSHNAPASIQGPEDGEAATPPLLELVQKASQSGADGVIIGCFDDTALAEAAKRAKCPVLGIGQAAYHLAALRQWRFSVVTTLPVSVPIIEGNIQGLGLGGHLARVRASDVPVLALEEQADDGIDALILGCAGMVRVTQAVRQALDITVLDPVEVSVRAMRWVLSNRL